MHLCFVSSVSASPHRFLVVPLLGAFHAAVIRALTACVLITVSASARVLSVICVIIVSTFVACVDKSSIYSPRAHVLGRGPHSL